MVITRLASCIYVVFESVSHSDEMTAAAVVGRRLLSQYTQDARRLRSHIYHTTLASEDKFKPSIYTW